MIVTEELERSSVLAVKSVSHSHLIRNSAYHSFDYWCSTTA